MTRAEFFATYARIVSEGRARNFPAMRPSERAAAAVHDQAQARKVWRRSRTTLSGLTVAEFVANEAQSRKDEETSR